jgi:hypothetical protein
MYSIRHSDISPTNHILSLSNSTMVVALEPSYYLTAGDVENVVKNPRDFSIMGTGTSYHDLFVQAVNLPDDEVRGQSKEQVAILTFV